MAHLRYIAIEVPSPPRRQNVNTFNHLQRPFDYTDWTVTAPDNGTL